MTRKLDRELQAYKEQVGDTEYQRLYRLYYSRTHRVCAYSGREEPLPAARLVEIKAKYKEGVPKGEVERWLSHGGCK